MIYSRCMVHSVDRTFCSTSTLTDWINWWDM